LVVGAWALTACAPVDGLPTPTPSAPTPGLNLTLPGAARAAVDELAKMSKTPLAIKVTVTKTTATLTYVEDDAAVTLGWTDGVVTKIDSDVTYVGQTGFAVDEFNLADVGQMFGQAALLADSSQNQELQINEYNTGHVLMTVTTSPESQTIFFRPDATLISWLDFTTAAGVKEAISDVAAGRRQVIDLGLNDQGFYADATADATIIERQTRPARLPVYGALRNGTSTLTAFDPAAVDPAVVAKLLADAPAKAGKPETPATMIIDCRDSPGVPTIRVSVGLTAYAYTLDGTEVPKQGN